MSHATVVEKIEGAPNWLLRPSTAISNSDFEKALETALAQKGMLAPEGTAPVFAIDAEIHFDATGAAWDGIRVDSEVRYVVVKLPDRSIVFDKTIRTQSNKPPLNDGSVWKTLFLTPPTRMFDTASKAYETAARTNIEEFFSLLGLPIPAQ